MIVSGILTIFYLAVYAVALPLLAFPDASFPANITNSIASASSALNALNVVIPVDTLIAIITLFITTEAAIFTYKMIRWVYQKIPGIN